MKVAVVAAVEAELGPLEGTALGVGPLRAAAAAARLVEATRPDAVVLVGSAGSYPGGPAVGEVVSSRLLGWADGASALNQAYVPLPPAPVEGAPTLLAHTDVTRATVLTVAAITTEPALIGALARYGEQAWEVEHLEATAVAVACAQAGVPFLALLGIANRVGPNAHEEWKQNRASAERGACAAARCLLAALQAS